MCESLEIAIIILLKAIATEWLTKLKMAKNFPTRPKRRPKCREDFLLYNKMEYCGKFIICDMIKILFKNTE